MPARAELQVEFRVGRQLRRLAVGNDARPSLDACRDRVRGRVIGDPIAAPGSEREPDA